MARRYSIKETFIDPLILIFNKYFFIYNNRRIFQIAKDMYYNNDYFINFISNYDINLNIIIMNYKLIRYSVIGEIQ